MRIKGWQLLRLRLGLLLGFVAVFVALALPVSRLALDVQSGTLGGVCKVFVGQGNASDSPSNTTKSHQGHCELCGWAGLALLPVLSVVLPAVPGFVWFASQIPQTVLF